MSYARNVIWPWEPGWWVLLGGALVSGAGMGYVFGLGPRAAGGRRLVCLVASLAIAMALPSATALVLRHISM